MSFQRVTFWQLSSSKLQQKPEIVNDALRWCLWENTTPKPEFCKIEDGTGTLSDEVCHQQIHPKGIVKTTSKNCGVGEDSWESLGCTEIKPVHPKGNQSWIFIGRTDVKTPILWPPDAKNWRTGTDPGAGKDWRQEEKGLTEDEMVAWYHRVDGPECE